MSQGKRFWGALALLAAAAAMVRVATTWRVFTDTTDEAYHLACGIQIFDQKRYNYETLHPPLARAVLSVLPWLGGARSQGRPTPELEGQVVLHSAGDYWGTLVRARAGNLLFFALAIGAVWSLGRRLWGEPEAAFSVLLFTLLPPVLAHAGLATLDMAHCATLLWALIACDRFVYDPRPRNAALFGAAAGAGIACKFSILLFFPPIFAVFAVLRWRRELVKAVSWRAAGIAAAACFAALWCAYGFQTGPMREPPDRRFLAVDSTVGASGPVHDAIYRLTELPLPLSKLVRGLGELFLFNFYGWESYLFGRLSNQGWLLFFPVMIGVKTPLAFLAMVLGSAWLAVRSRTWADAAPLAAALAVVAVCVPSRINIGLRHVLPFFPLAALSAGYALERLRRREGRGAVAAAACVAALLLPSLAAHPDYLADFNLLAGRDPAHITVDSDLDWGQDLHRATDYLRSEGAAHAWLAYEGSFDAAYERRVQYRPLPPGQRVSGWVAISVRALRRTRARAAAGGTLMSYDWLTAYPARKVGRSMLVYRVPSD